MRSYWTDIGRRFHLALEEWFRDGPSEERVCRFTEEEMEGIRVRCQARQEQEAAALEARKERYRDVLKRVRPEPVALPEVWQVVDERGFCFMLGGELCLFDSEEKAQAYVQHLSELGWEGLSVEKA